MCSTCKTIDRVDELTRDRILFRRGDVGQLVTLALVTGFLIGLAVGGLAVLMLV